jgi:hypothetical protein
VRARISDRAGFRERRRLGVPDIFASSGSLAAFLWLQAARAVNADASIATYTRLGLILASLMLAGSLGVLLPIAAHGF